MEHKKNVFIECWKEKLYIHAFTHDLSKFIPDKEFNAYANWFYGKYGKAYKGDYSVEHEMAKTRFDWAWKHHYTHNKHHWDYWSAEHQEMPREYIKQMICDWKGMARKFGDTAQAYYLKNYKNKFSNQYGLNNMKSSLNKGTKMTVLNFVRWCEILGLKWNMTVEDNGGDRSNPLPDVIEINSEQF
jgi:hypothetical protein